MRAKSPEELVLLGTVSKAHGLRGEIKVYPYSGDPDRFVRSYRRLYLAGDAGDPVEYPVQQARVQGRQVLVLLRGCSDRNAAEQLRGFRVYGAEEDLPELAEGEFYLHQLEGRELVDESGKHIGRCTGFLDTGGAELLVVNRDGEEVLIPAVGEFILAVEPDRVIVSLPPGLLDING